MALNSNNNNSNNNNNNSNNMPNRSNRTQSSTTITSLITRLQQSFSDAMSTQKTVVDKRAFEKTYKNMDKVIIIFVFCILTFVIFFDQKLLVTLVMSLTIYDFLYGFPGFL